MFSLIYLFKLNLIFQFKENAGKQYHLVENEVNLANNDFISDTLAEQQVLLP